MTPYYSESGIDLYHADFRDGLASLGVQADCCIADPPYGETSLTWDRWLLGWPDAVVPHVKQAGSMWCFGSFRMFTSRWAQFAGWRLSQDIVWEKHNGSGFHADRFKRIHELAAHFYRGPWENVFKRPVYTMDARAKAVRVRKQPTHTGSIGESCSYKTRDGGPRLHRSVIAARSCNGEAENETQKPLGIIRPLIEYSWPPGGLLLSPFAGAGSDLVAAKEMGMRAIGFEVREDQCEAAANRLRQGVLFGATV